MRARTVAAPVVGIVVFFGLWELVVRLGNVRPIVLRAPSGIVRFLIDNPRAYWKATQVTAAHAGIALAASLAIALVIGALLASSRFAEEATNPVVTLVQVTPFVVYLPSVVLWLGAGNPPVLVIATLVCLPAFVFAAVSGLRSADPAAVELLASVDASWWEQLVRLRFPSALPALSTAARYNIGLVLIAVYLVEGRNYETSGLGFLGRRADSFNEADGVWATVFCMAALGVIGLTLIGVVDRRLLRWHASQRA
ncbi:MAG: ABC transporter permease subunit [Acidimicrobiia bacterium]|jgi:NitT/TauT family transport system permease protein|nr:ABC transporter permease subunit [Acidimicrobiia bacterium]MDQ3391355.1 ABC transporter permease subunit [Actinomycetota bacterium]